MKSVYGYHINHETNQVVPSNIKAPRVTLTSCFVTCKCNLVSIAVICRVCYEHNSCSCSRE